MAATATFTAYAVARQRPGISGAEARTTTAVVLFLVALQILVLLARPLTRLRRLFVLRCSLPFAGALVVPGVRRFFALEIPDTVVIAAAVGVALAAGLLLDAG